jgi:hypothetical protein
MKVLFTGLYPMWDIHYVMELNLVERHLSAGDEVTILYCDEVQTHCEANKNHDLHHCARCIGIRQSGLALLSQEIHQLPLIAKDLEETLLPAELQKFSCVPELKEKKVDGFDIGWATYSSLVDQFRIVNPDFNEHGPAARNIMVNSLRIYRTAQRYLDKFGFKKVYIFNGRYAAARPWVRACESKKIPFTTHEKLLAKGRLITFENTLPHDPRPYPARVEKFWSDHSHRDEVQQEAKDFFEERPQGIRTGGLSFVTGQNQTAMPVTWKKDQRNFAIFPTTEREFVGIGGITLEGLFSSQLEAYLYVGKICLADLRVHLTMRIHPNSALEKERWWESRELQKLPNLTIIPPESSISSYNILFQCEKMVTFRSSMALEATYWGKPAITLVPTSYSGLEAAYEPQNLSEAEELLLKTLEPKPQVNAMKFAAFMRCGGENPPFSNYINYYTLDFKGTILEARQDVHEWLGHCEKRPAVSGLKKWLRTRRDRRDFRRLWIECDGWFAESPKK